MSVHPHIALVVPFQTSANLCNGELEAGANISRAECLYKTPFILFVLFWDLQSLFHCATVQSLLNSILRLHKADFRLKVSEIPVMQIYMKGFTVGSKLTCTDFLQMSGHLEKEKYQRSPYAFQNVSFPSAEGGPSTQ